MSSHREAPEISKDPVADSTDVYAFVSPDQPGTVTLIANYIPLEAPAGGPNFYEFGDDVLYEIHVDNNGDGRADVTYQFRFTHQVTNPEHLPLQHRPDPVPDSPNWNRRQTYYGHQGRRRGTPGARHRAGLPAVQHRAAVDPGLRARWPPRRVHPLGGGIRVFAGQRAEGFYVDLGAIFDLGDLRPFEQLPRHVRPGHGLQTAPGVNSTDGVNVHSHRHPGPDHRLTRR